MATERYALNYLEIDNAINDFSSLKPSYNFSLYNQTDRSKIYRIEKKGQHVTLTLYLLKGGFVSHQIQPKEGFADLNSTAEECWRYLVDSIHIQCVSTNFFKFRNVNSSDFDGFMSIASDDYSYTVKDEVLPNNSFQSRKTISEPNGAVMSVNYYNNGTLTLQGSLTPMFTYMWTECVSLLGDIDNSDREQFLMYSTGPETEVINPDLSKHINNLEIISGTKIDIFVETSIKLANLGKVYDDNSWISCCILKGLDALMSLKLQEACPFENKDSYTKFFHEDVVGGGNYVFNESIVAFDSKPLLKSNLEKGYSFLRKERNTSFHIDRKVPASSRTMSYEEAVEVIEDALKIINSICNNW